MAKLPVPTPSQRGDTRTFARQIVNAVESEVPMVLGIEERHVMSYARLGRAVIPAYVRDEVEPLIFRLAQEVDLDRLARARAKQLADAIESHFAGSSDRAYVRECLKSLREALGYRDGVSPLREDE